MTHWLGRGIDGWRLDAAYSIATDFWAQVIPRVKEQYPDAWIMGEVIHGDYNGFVEQSKVDSITEYELWKSIWSSISNKTSLNSTGPCNDTTTSSTTSPLPPSSATTTSPASLATSEPTAPP